MPPAPTSLSAGSLSLASAAVLRSCLSSPSSVLFSSDLVPGPLPSVLLQLLFQVLPHPDEPPPPTSVLTALGAPPCSLPSLREFLLVWSRALYARHPSVDALGTIGGIVPHSLVHLIALTVPGVLVEDAVGLPIVTGAMVIARDLVIAEIMQKNAVMDAMRDSGMASIRNRFFDAIRRSLRPNAPLLL